VPPLLNFVLIFQIITANYSAQAKYFTFPPSDFSQMANEGNRHNLKTIQGSMTPRPDIMNNGLQEDILGLIKIDS
jgi:hypothetical protein